MTFILIHSPLVGPLFWNPTASALTSAGCTAITPRADIRRCFDIAAARGWVTERHESSHFHPLNDPARMAGMLVRVGTRVGERRRR